MRILVDSWLSDYAVGDLMERNTKIKLDPEKMKSIDAIYISHAHTDHLDPYTLVEIYGSKTPFVKGDKGDLVSEKNPQSPHSSSPAPLQRSSQKLPLLILPVTLRFLAPVFAEYLPTAQIHYLAPREPYTLNGVEITGYMFSQADITNEDAVMMISISNDRELLFAEIDTVPDEYDADIATQLFQIFDRKEYQTRCYLASRNELE